RLWISGNYILYDAFNKSMTIGMRLQYPLNIQGLRLQSILFHLFCQFIKGGFLSVALLHRLSRRNIAFFPGMIRTYECFGYWHSWTTKLYTFSLRCINSFTL